RSLSSLPSSVFRLVGRYFLFEPHPDIRPLRGQNTIEHAVPGGSVAAGLVVAEDAVALSAESLDGGLRARVEEIGAQTDYAAAQCLEGVGHQQQFARGVHVRALETRGVPRVANLHTINLC